MEQLVLGIFQEQLAKVIIGFRKEQVNANLLNGKGEIRDVSLNCSMFNESIARVCPFIRMEEIHVSRIGFHVSSWTNLRKAPIIVDIGHITAKIEEPLTILPMNQRQRIEMITESELIKKLSEGFQPFRGSGSYGLADRIVDNLTIEIESFQLEFQTWGKFKTRRRGPWTPPLFQVGLKNLRISSVDAEGSEGSPDQVWAHNQGRRDSFLTYKKMTGDCQLQIVPQYQECNDKGHSHPLHELSKLTMEIQIAVERRIRDGAVLACQLDVTLPEIDIDIDSTDVRLLAHLASGFQYCLAKDRSFVDPLKSHGGNSNAASASSSPSVLDLAIMRNDSTESLRDVNEEEDSIDNSIEDVAQRSSDGSSIGDDGSAASSCTDDKVDENGFDDDETSAVNIDSPARNNKNEKPSTNRAKLERSVILLPNGLIIYESVSFTCSIHKLVLWGSYPGDEEKGLLELVAKGCIIEAIWPNVNREHGLYVQVSTSFVSLQERVGHHKKTLLLAGMHRNDHLSLHLPSRKPQEIHADEFFPLFERRNIRDDPLELRHLFPTQAFGVKTTIDILNQSKDDKTHNRFMVLHEIGADEIEITFDTDIILRITRFFVNTNGEGFDPRWNTGEWSDFLTVDMLHKPTETFHLDKHLQACTQLFLDENLMISSDLFNVTARLTNVAVRIPAAVRESLRSCDIVLKWEETIFVVSSALPRTFLTGRIGNSISGDARQDSEKGIIDFPNDPSDICYKCEQGLVRKTISTCRLQLTTRGFEVKIVPVIPFCNAPETEKVISITDFTTIFSIEGEPPTVDCNKMKITVFLSVLIQELILNIDFDILAGAICTLLCHKKHIVEIIEIIQSTFAQTQDGEAAFSQGNEPQLLENTKIKQSLKGRRLLAKRHMSQSRETGGLAIIFCLQLKDLSLGVWRQNVPISSPLRNNLQLSNTLKCYGDEEIIELLNILDFEMKDAEVGIEFAFRSNSDYRIVVKSYVTHAILSIVNLSKEIEEHKADQHKASSSSKKIVGKDVKATQWNLTKLCSFGNESLPCGLNPSGLAQQFAFRMEAHHKNNAQSWSMAADISAPSTINLEVEAITAATLLIIESLLLPSWSNNSSTKDETFLFPSRTIGAMIVSSAKEVLGNQCFDLNGLDSLEIDNDSSDPVLERVLRSMSKKFLPLNLQVILLRCEIANLLISIPSENSKEEKQKSNVSFHLNQADIITRFYPTPGSPPSEIEHVLACKGTDWLTLINTNKEGFYQYVYSRQSLLSIIEGNDEAKLETVIHPFEISFTYSGAEVNLSMEKGISIDDIRLIEKIQSSLKSAAKVSLRSLSEIYIVAGAMMYGDIADKNASKSIISSQETVQSNNCRSSQTQKFLRFASEELRLYEKSVRDGMLKKDNELEKLKIYLFQTERERFGAMTLLASRVAGWIRMGSQHRSGQRVVKKSLLWPFWAILRKQILVLYPRPGDPKPSDIISLVNARVRNLAGGKSKQDTKRGFAIVEESGMIRYFVTGQTQEYELWINEINRAIRLYSDPTKVLDLEGSNKMDASQITIDDLENKTDDMPEENQNNTKIGNRLSSAFQSAKLKGKEFAERRQSTSSAHDSTQDDNPSNISNEVQSNSELSNSRRNVLPKHQLSSRRAEIGMKFSKVGLVTKSRLGSAIQTAREKRDEIANRRKNQDLSPNSTENCDYARENVVDSFGSAGTMKKVFQEHDAHEHQDASAAGTGLQLGNKLGLAIQNAKIKARESIEKQSRSQGSERQADKTPNDSSTTSDSLHEHSLHGSIGSVLDPLRNTTETLQSSSRSKDFFREDGHKRNSRFSFLKRAEDSQNDSLFGGELLTLRNIYLENDVIIPGASRGETISLKILKDDWFINVSRIKNNDISHDGEEENSEAKLRNVKDDLSETSNHTETSIGTSQNISCDYVTSSSFNKQMTSGIQPGELQNEVQEVVTDASDQISIKKQKGDPELSLQQAKDCVSEIDINGFSEPRDGIPYFLVKVLRVQQTQNIVSFEKQWSFGDVLELYVGVSEVLRNHFPHYSGRYSGIFDGSSEFPAEKASRIASFEKLILCGRILGGLLETRESFEHIEDFRHYQCESIENFLNAVLECPLPIDGLTLVSNALGINGPMEDFRSITNKSQNKGVRDSYAPSHPDEEDVIKNLEASSSHTNTCPANVLKLLTACEIELQRGETRTASMERSQQCKVNQNSLVPHSVQIQPVFYEPLLPPKLTDHIHESIQKSLMDAMAERDEAHAQLIGANVMHTHSLERMRKKNERLEIDATLSEEIAKIRLQQDPQPHFANFFGKSDEKLKKMQDAIIRKIEKVTHMIRNNDTDAEMTELCSQLASEISTKTSFALEIKRLNEIREKERTTHSFEKEAMKNEMRRLQKLLEVERQETSKAYNEVSHWKALYEERQAGNDKL